MPKSAFTAGVISAERAREISTRAVNLAESDIAKKVGQGYYAEKGAMAPGYMKSDLIAAIKKYIAGQLGMVSNTDAVKVSSINITLTSDQGVDAVFWGFGNLGCLF